MASSSSTSALAPPDGLPEGDDGKTHSGFTVLAFAILGSLMAVGLSGIVGGGAPTTTTLDMREASLSVRTPQVLRNGEFFEMQVIIETRGPIADLVLTVEPSLWRNVTINSQIPAPADEAFEQGAYAFHYGPVDAGERVEVKFDGQINPPMFGGTRGAIGLRDGDRTLGAMPMRIRVFP